MIIDLEVEPLIARRSGIQLVSACKSMLELEPGKS